MSESHVRLGLAWQTCAECGQDVIASHDGLTLHEPFCRGRAGRMLVALAEAIETEWYNGNVDSPAYFRLMNIAERPTLGLPDEANERQSGS